MGFFSSLFEGAKSLITGGPFISEGIDALTSTFAGAMVDSAPSPGPGPAPSPGPQAPTGPPPVTVEDVRKIIDEAKTSLTAELKKSNEQIGSIFDAMKTDQALNAKQRIQNQIAALRKPIQAALDYFETESADNGIMDNNIRFLTPFTADVAFEQYISFSKTTPMVQKRDDLVASLHELRHFLADGDGDIGGVGGAGTNAAFDLYILTATWLIIYDKALLRLQSFRARCNLSPPADITTYLLCADQVGLEIQMHVTEFVKFLLGGPSAPGYIQKCHKARIDKIGNWEKTDVWKFADGWHPTAVGYLGAPPTMSMRNTLALTAESEQANTRDGYILANTLAFERSMTPTIEIAEAWKQSLANWAERKPLTPLPSLDGTNPTIHLEFKAVPAEPDASGEVNSYYDQKHKLSYCIALVTAHGEGFASRWSPWVEFPRKVEKTHVKVWAYKPLANGLPRQDPAHILPVGSPGSSVPIAVRLYAKWQDKQSATSYSHMFVAEIPPSQQVSRSLTQAEVYEQPCFFLDTAVALG